MQNVEYLKRFSLFFNQNEISEIIPVPFQDPFRAKSSRGEKPSFEMECFNAKCNFVQLVGILGKSLTILQRSLTPTEIF